MKLGVVKNKGAAVITDNGYVLLNRLGFVGSIEQLISVGADGLAEIKNNLSQSNEFSPFKNEELDAPIRKPGKIVAIGLNYIDHASESKMDLPKQPLIFAKINSSITGPFHQIII